MTPELQARIVADSRDRVAWLRARARGITATDVAGLTSDISIKRAADSKLGAGPRFAGNAYTEHGRRREPAIAAWVSSTHGIHPSSALFRAEIEQRHLATPDGVVQQSDGRILLAEIKTTNKSWRTIPRTYLRQVWWQQHVLGAERTLFVWEEHDNFRVIHDEPKSVWIDRDDREIAQLVGMATRLIDELYHRTTGQRPPEQALPDAAARREALRERDAFRALALMD
ncbi:YqaJ viral recombinase family protein [uncultured Microbacterium sp.]|uniref:YqaJ viral recombinase family protein n=1 Tax=uncultured Microbacterium sp. TaxID=191216 RepID=UPI002613F2AB|nr:YqaJ viral recombinase family protein [uncultured Microbacterium sp.]